jgi:hypothetical protein
MNLSGSQYRAGLRCPTLLWKRLRRPAREVPERGVPSLESDEADVIARHARALHPGGRAITGEDSREAAEQTVALLPLRIPLYGAVFRAGGARACIDVLVPEGAEGGWRLVRVRPGASVRDAHLEDLAFQWHAVAAAGLSVTGCAVYHVNGRYRRNGEIDAAGLLVCRDVTEAVHTRRAEVSGRLGGLFAVAAQPDSPSNPIGPQCLQGGGCRFQSECWAFLPEFPVTDLSGDHRGLRWQLLASGIRSLADIPDAVELNARQRTQREAVRRGQVQVDAAALRAFLSQLRWPLAFLDIEALSSPVPWYDGTSPFEALPVQFSVHIQREPAGPTEHHEFLAAGADDPRPALFHALRECLPAEGSIVTYDAALERRCLQQAFRGAVVAAGRAAWEERVIDLMDPFRVFAWHHAAQHGGISLKLVSAALTGRSYDGLLIQDGLAAARAFAAAAFADLPAEERQRLREALRDYCRMDTLAMAGVVDALGRAVGAGE